MSKPQQPDATIEASDFIQEADRNVDPTLDEGRVPVLEADGKLHKNFIPLLGISKSNNIINPVADDSLTMFFTERAITLSQINTVIQGASSPEVVFAIRHGLDRTDGKLLEFYKRVTSTTTGQEIVPVAIDALDLESASSQYAAITDAASTGLNMTGDFTIEAWVKIESLGSTIVIAGKGNLSSQSTRQYHLEIDSGGTMALWTSNGSSTSIINATSDVTVGVWTHIAVAYDESAGRAYFYINAIDAGSPTGGETTLNTSTEPFWVGARLSGASYQLPFDGQIRDLRVWSDLRTSTEIANNILTTLVGNETNLEALWLFDSDYLDTTANDNDLTPVNSPVFTEVTSPVIAANSWVWLEILSKDGTVTELSVTTLYESSD